MRTKEELRAYKKAWHEANRQRHRRAQEAYRKTHPERTRAFWKTWYQANRERILAQRKAYRKANPKPRLTWDRSKHGTYYQANRERILARSKAYQRINRKRRSDYYKVYRQTNKKELSTKDKVYRKINSERIRARRGAYYQANKEWITKWGKSYRQLNRERRRAVNKAWINGNSESALNARLRMRYRNVIHYAIRRQFGKKAFKTMQLLGCDIHWLKAWLEVQWRPGMSWKNYGQYGWHIDHKRPCASFDLTDPVQQKLCCHWTNLQPLWAAENFAKSDSWEPELAAA